MYVPPQFKVSDEAEIFAFMQKHRFATLVTFDGAAPFATHLPVLVDAGNRLITAHLAKANPQWKHFAAGQEVLVMFQGPHAYVSPSMYQTSPAVPTWNYAAVHVYGVPRIIADHDRLVAMLSSLVEANEAGRKDRWQGEMPAEFRDKMVQGIVGFELEITRIEAKYKLSQNRSEADVTGVINALNASADQTERDLAAMMSRCTQGDA